MVHYEDLRPWKYRTTGFYSIATNIIPDKGITTHYISLTSSGMLTITPGYAWDGASGGIDTENFMRASLVHDALCQLIGDGFLPQSHRKGIDKLLRKICIEDGMSRIRAWWVYYSVRSYVWLRYR